MTSNGAELSIGGRRRLLIRHACPGGTRLYPNDGLQWHRFEVSFTNTAFQANLTLDTWLSEILEFREQLAALNRDLRGIATISTTEGDLKLEATADKLGHIEWTGRLRYPGPEPEITMEFTIQDDQTSLSKILAQADEIIAEARREPS